MAADTQWSLPESPKMAAFPKWLLVKEELRLASLKYQSMGHNDEGMKHV